MTGPDENSKDLELNAIYELIERIAPEKSECFTLELDSKDESEEFFSLESENSKIKVRANSLSALSMGLGCYFKNICNASISWHASAPIELPDKLPQVDAEISQKCSVKNRFFLNYCTYGYTMPWWKMEDWSRLIDWMALNGVNLTLATMGQEYIWLKVWQKFGLTDQQIRQYFTGPAHLPWHQMANIDRWQGPLPESYINQRYELQKEVLKRLRALGIKPILPAFSGHVPIELKEKYPDADIKSLGGWAEFPEEYSTYFLNPLDPLFSEIQKEYLVEQRKEFGTDHYYGLDSFNEVEPPTWEPEYLASVFSKLYETLEQVDSEAIWIQMGWMFYFDREKWTSERIKASLDAVPKHKMLLLDYWTEKVEIWRRTEAFYGTDYIWCYLGNFGGNTRIMGAADVASERFKNTIESSESKNICGVGSTLEGMGVNQVMHDLVFELPWQKDNFDLKEWFKNYGKRRSGINDANTKKAWELILKHLHSEHNNTDSVAISLINSRKPEIEPQKLYKYDNRELLKIWKLLLSCDSKITGRNSIQYDIVNLGRQLLANHSYKLLEKCNEAWNAKDKLALKSCSEKFLEIFDDLETLLATRSEFSLGKWLADAKSYAANAKEEDYYLHNARVILTTWGPQGHMLSNYAAREWADMATTYYKPRWEKLFLHLQNALENNTEFPHKEYEKIIADIEWKWTLRNDIPEIVSQNSVIEIAKNLYIKYADEILWQSEPEVRQTATETSSEGTKKTDDYFTKFS